MHAMVLNAIGAKLEWTEPPDRLPGPDVGACPPITPCSLMIVMLRPIKSPSRIRNAAAARDAMPPPAR